MLRLSVEQHLSFLDSVLGNGDDVTISAALAPAPQWPRPAHDACNSRREEEAEIEEEETNTTGKD